MGLIFSDVKVREKRVNNTLRVNPQFYLINKVCTQWDSHWPSRLCLRPAQLCAVPALLEPALAKHWLAYSSFRADWVVCGYAKDFRTESVTWGS